MTSSVPVATGALLVLAVNELPLLLNEDRKQLSSVSKLFRRFQPDHYFLNNCETMKNWQINSQKKVPGMHETFVLCNIRNRIAGKVYQLHSHQVQQSTLSFLGESIDFKQYHEKWEEAVIYLAGVVRYQSILDHRSHETKLENLLNPVETRTKIDMQIFSSISSHYTCTKGCSLLMCCGGPGVRQSYMKYQHKWWCFVVLGMRSMDTDELMELESSFAWTNPLYFPLEPYDWLVVPNFCMCEFGKMTRDSL